MKKNILSITDGENNTAYRLLANRLLPTAGYGAVGPIVLVEHTFPVKPGGSLKERYPHPHRGIIACTYVLEGELTHMDSIGNHATVGAGGLHWLNAGNGVMHDEYPRVSGDEQGVYHAVQFWINLPPADKDNTPEHVAMQSENIPQVLLPGNAGIMSIITGSFGTVASPLRTYSQEFIFHIRLNPKSAFTFPAKESLQYGAFVPSLEVLVNGSPTGKSKLVIFEKEGMAIHLKNIEISFADIFIFGGACSNEQTVRQGPFVMNSYSDLAAAYRDFFAGEYGTIFYE